MYFIRTDADDAAVLYYVPFLPERSSFRWATPDEVTADHIALDLGPVAQLLYVADIEPHGATDVAAIEAIDHALTDYGCDMARVGAEVEGDLADHPGSCARWSRCLTLAARLTGVKP